MTKLEKVVIYIIVLILILMVAAVIYHVTTGVEEDFREALNIDKENPLTISDDGDDTIHFVEDTSYVASEYFHYMVTKTYDDTSIIFTDIRPADVCYDIGVGTSSSKFGFARIYADTVEIRDAKLVIIYGDAEVIRRSEDD